MEAIEPTTTDPPPNITNLSPLTQQLIEKNITYFIIKSSSFVKYVPCESIERLFAGL